MSGTQNLKRLMRAEWYEIELPRPWRPRVIGEELIGYYGGRTLRNGSYGQYEVILVTVPKMGCYTISGTDIIQRVDVARLQEGDPIKVIWGGRKDLGDDRYKKLYELYVTKEAVL